MLSEQPVIRAGMPIARQAAANKMAVPVHDAPSCTVCCGLRYAGDDDERHVTGGCRSARRGGMTHPGEHAARRVSKHALQLERGDQGRKRVHGRRDV